MAQYFTGKRVLNIHNSAVNSQKAQLKAQSHIQRVLDDKSMSAVQRIGYLFWLRQYVDGAFDEIGERLGVQEVGQGVQRDVH